ncbi:MAG: HEPN domain-containing protein [Chloroflexota bacterium]|nr:MAG: HEPN domain-containing protein [Chloroflexota bacterium]
MAERSADWMDLAHARHDLESEFYEWACFSSQQAAEKAAKAVLNRRGAEAWGHSVADLIREIGRFVVLRPDLLDAAFELDKAYTPTRYPDAHQTGSPSTRYTRTEAQRMVEHAARIVSACEDLLSAD